MGQIWLHIGSPKTGTTAIQAFLSGNAETLRENHGVNYVRAGRPNIAHNQLAAAARQGQSEALFEQIAEEVAADPEAQHIISSELLFTPQTARLMLKLVPEKMRKQTKLVCYIRRQDSYLEALYKQFLKNSRISPDRQAFLQDAPRRIRYLDVLDGYAGLFGAEAMFVRPFSRDALVGGDVVQDFAALIGLELTDNLQLPGMDTNKTLSAAMSELLASLGTHTNYNPREVIREIIALNDPRMIRKRDVFTRSERRRYMEGLHDENADLIARYMPDCEAFFDISDLRDETEEELRERVVLELDDRIAAQDAMMQAIGTIQRRRQQEAELAAESNTEAETAGADKSEGIPSWYQEIFPAGERQGWYENLGDHSLSFVDRGGDQLVVSFDNLSQAGNTEYLREPWAQKFCADNGFSHLGVYAQMPNWFRDATLIDKMEALASVGFFETFPRVAFTGTSMGGFAALAFGALAPGATLVAFSPQTTLDPQIIPWEQRFPRGRAADWSLPYSDAIAGVEAAARSYVVYDPFHIGDKAHIDRLPDSGLVRLKGFGLGHKSALVLNRMDLLKTVMKKSIAGTLTPQQFYRDIRKRKTIYLYRQTMEGHLTARGHPERAERFGELFKHYRKQRGAA